MESGITASESGITDEGPGITASESGITDPGSEITAPESGITDPGHSNVFEIRILGQKLGSLRTDENIFLVTTLFLDRTNAFHCLYPVQ